MVEIGKKYVGRIAGSKVILLYADSDVMLYYSDESKNHYTTTPVLFHRMYKEYVEPKIVGGYLNVNSNGSVFFYKSRADADNMRSANRIACKYVEVTEGTFDA